MARLTLTRTPGLFGALRTMAVLVDGAERARLTSGASTTVEVDDGPHTVVAKLDWTRSRPITLDLTAGEHATLEAGVSPAALLAAFTTPGTALRLTHRG